jgi:hypothetical protein
MSSSRFAWSGRSAANPGVNQVPVRDATMASVPSARTVAARARQESGSGKRAAEAHTTRLSSRSGWWIASH